MSKISKINKEILRDSLEKILFDENDLNALKKAIHELAENKIDTRSAKQAIIDSRCRLFEDLLRFFPFYAGCSANNESDLKSELKEKDEFLTEIAFRINNIYENLKNNLNTSNTNQSQSRFLNNLIKKIEIVTKDADEAFELKRFEEFVRLKFLSVEKVCLLVYLKIFEKSFPEEKQLKIDDILYEIENKKNEKIVDHEQLKKWRRIRNRIAHDHVKIKEEKAIEAKEFFDMLVDKLEKLAINS